MKGKGVRGRVGVARNDPLTPPSRLRSMDLYMITKNRNYTHFYKQQVYKQRGSQMNLA